MTPRAALVERMAAEAKRLRKMLEEIERIARAGK